MGGGTQTLGRKVLIEAALKVAAPELRACRCGSMLLKKGLVIDCEL
jgi:hypothetical protein